MSLYPMDLFYTAIQEELYFPAGFLKKPIGMDGQIAAIWSNDLDVAETVKLPALFIEISHIKVPYRIQKLILTGDRATIQLYGIQSKTEAYRLRNASLWLPLSLSAKLSAKTTCSFLIDCLVVDPILGMLGKVETIYYVQGQHTLSTDYNGKELLIPHSLVVDINKQQRLISVKLPEGYLEAIF